LKSRTPSSPTREHRARSAQRTVKRHMREQGGCISLVWVVHVQNTDHKISQPQKPQSQIRNQNPPRGVFVLVISGWECTKHAGLFCFLVAV
jgi:hypothetical protein